MDSSDSSLDSFSLNSKNFHGFDFTGHIRLLCEDIITRVPDFSHIRLEQVAIVFSQTRKQVAHGLYATLTPMRFEAGSETTTLHGRLYKTPRLFNPSGQEVLYILSFYLPRFFETNFNEKLITIFHELWHISPVFNGDLRRYPGRCYAHSHSQKQYDKQMQEFVNQWLSNIPPQKLYQFLHLSFQDLIDLYGGIYGAKVPHPKLTPLT